MSAEEFMKQLTTMDNAERIKLLEMLHKEYFDIGISDEQREREIRILETYYDGELIWDKEFTY